MQGIRAFFSFLFLVAALSACRGSVDVWTQTWPLSEKIVQTSVFQIYARARLSVRRDPVVVYIEGDGAPWSERGVPSLDPTPRLALGLRLAESDSSSNVIYLARPCQYIPRGPACDPTIWTERRYAEQTSQALLEALRKLVPDVQPVHLVAYSGGAVAATYIAAHRDNILSLRTIAGNLDTRTLAAYHGFASSPEEWNPIDSAQRLSELPQAHWVGEKDAVVPPFIARLFLGAMKTAPCAMIIPEPEATHAQGWARIWPRVLKDNPLDHCVSTAKALFVLTADE